MCAMPSLIATSVLAALASLAASAPQYNSSWKALVTGSECPSATYLSPKDDGPGDVIRCMLGVEGRRHFLFPAGQFDIDEQVVVPANTTLEGNENPTDASNKTLQPDLDRQTLFLATHGLRNHSASYCGTRGNLQQGDAQRLRVGFLLHSHTAVKNVSFQGLDTVRPHDNGNLCGGAVFETPGCVSPGFSNGVGTNWIGRHGCVDAHGNPNDLVTGDGLGVEDVVIENVRLNDVLGWGSGSQMAVWVAQTRDGSATRNVTVTNLVSMFTLADGINFHGNVQDSLVENSHIERTGDDIFAVWGGYYQPAGIVFRNNTGKDAGASRNHTYGVCIAVYGAFDVVFTGMTCYDPPENHDSCIVKGKCNSCMAYIHDGWFGAVYASGNSITVADSRYLDMSGKPIVDRPTVRTAHKTSAVVMEQAEAFLP